MRIIDKVKYAEIGRQVRKLALEKPCSSYEWEELVQKLYDSADADLHDIGVRELEILRLKCPDCPVFSNC